MLATTGASVNKNSQGLSPSVSNDASNVTTVEGQLIDGQSPFDLSRHALMNTVVLDSLFKYYIGEADLKSSRLVCKLWNQVTIPFVRSRFQVHIEGEHKGAGCPNSIENFIWLIRSNTLELPFGRFRLGGFDVTVGAGKQFLQICGNIAKEFVLDQPLDYTIENVGIFLKSAPKLESLVIPLDWKSVHGNVVQIFPGNLKRKTFICGTCGSRYERYNQLLIHDRVHMKANKINTKQRNMSRGQIRNLNILLNYF